jgi:hypothetical protein
MELDCGPSHMQIFDVACVDRVAGVPLTLQLAYVWRHAEFERDPRDLHRLPMRGRVMASSHPSPPSPPRTIAVNTPPLPLRNHGTRRWWRSWRTDGSWANEHSRALNRTGVANWPPENETYFTLSTTKQNTSSARQTARVCTEACQMASRQPRQPSRAIWPVMGLRAYPHSTG